MMALCSVPVHAVGGRLFHDAFVLTTALRTERARETMVLALGRPVRQTQTAHPALKAKRCTRKTTKRLAQAQRTIRNKGL